MGRRALMAVVLLASLAVCPRAQTGAVTRFPLARPTAALSRGLTTGAFFDVVGRRSAALGYEGRALEVWVYPLKVIDALQLSFSLDGYPLPIPAADLPGSIDVRPEATILTSSHAAFTVRQIIVAPIDEPAVVILLDIDTVLPMTVVGSFRPALKPMWPAGSSTANASWNAGDEAYELTEESGRFAARVGVPGGVDRSVMPYQEEPRDVPLQFSIEVSPERARRELVPIVVTASVEGRAAARAAHERVAASVDELYARTAGHYARLLASSTSVATPDPRLDRAFTWALVGMDKGFATNPALGTGLVAGFRTSGNSERPGFAWFFGRDALWTSLALTAAGNAAGARAALEFLGQHQRDDGKIPHEISQSAALVPWFTGFPYAWASADATPLFVIAHADAWRAGGDRAFLQRHWSRILQAYRFSAGTDADGNGLVDNTGAGHGWVEGGALYPPHEEIYLQGLWIEASRSLAEMARELGDRPTAEAADAAAERTRAAVEAVYWLSGPSHYAFATQQPRAHPAAAEPGPARARRQARLDELQRAAIIGEDTVLPAVPMWWGLLDPDRADAEIDRLGAAAMATDWGHRILSNASRLYDPLSYHYGSVWPLFTGWASAAAYRYGRPHVGYQALMANALLTESGALGWVTELLSGDVHAAFGRSSHHQVWSEAMVAAPLVRGMLGIEALDGGRRLRIAPQLPANWDRVALERILCAGVRFDVAVSRTPGTLRLRVTREPGATTAASPRLLLSPALPLDAAIERVTVNGSSVRPGIVRLGDVQFVEVAIERPAREVVAEIAYRGGSDVYVHTPAPAAGARSEGIRILRSRGGDRGLELVVEGLNGREYELFLRTTRQPGPVTGATLVRANGRDPIVRVRFDGEEGEYSRRRVVVSLRR